jgi:hypothetical protein
MAQTPWLSIVLSIAALFVGPALTTTFVTYFIQKRLNRQKTDLDESSATKLLALKTSLDESTQTKLTALKASLDQKTQAEIAQLKANLDKQFLGYRIFVENESQRRLEFNQYVENHQAALLESYVLIFEKNVSAGPVELLQHVYEGIDMIMKPFRLHEYLLTSDTKMAILAAANHLYEAIPQDGATPSPATVDRFKGSKELFFERVQRARTALLRELERREVH